MTRFNWIEVRDLLVEKLQEVEGISIVHNFPRLEKDRQRTRWVSVFQDAKRINAWTVTRVSNVGQFNVCRQIEVSTSILLIGMLEHNDELNTWDEFDVLIDKVQEKFYPNIHLDGSVLIQGPSALQVSELRQLSTTAVHYAEISIQALTNLHY